MKALLIPDEAGNGHKVRCGALASELERRGWSTVTCTQGQIPRLAFDVVVMDLMSHEAQVPGIGKTIRIIDEQSFLGPCDLLVFGSAGAGEEMLLESGTLLRGPRYSLLRPEFEAERCVTRMRSGIFDARNIAGWSVLEMAEELSLAKVVISYAGMRAMEAACVGTPSVLVARNPGERLNARGLMEAGAAVSVPEPDAVQVAERILACQELLERMNRKARALVDGKGCLRVADAIEELFK